jgi:hypothetical protein
MVRLLEVSYNGMAHARRRAGLEGCCVMEARWMNSAGRG